MLSGVCVTCLIRYCRIVAADLMARLALQKGAARRMAEAGAIAHLLTLLELEHSLGVRAVTLTWHQTEII